METPQVEEGGSAGRIIEHLYSEKDTHQLVLPKLDLFHYIKVNLLQLKFP
jgi:hypothetical protein